MLNVVLLCPQIGDIREQQWKNKLQGVIFSELYTSHLSVSCVCLVLLKDCLCNLTLLLSLLVTGGRETTALVESLRTAYSCAPSTRLKYLQRQLTNKKFDCNNMNRVETSWCILHRITTKTYHIPRFAHYQATPYMGRQVSSIYATESKKTH